MGNDRPFAFDFAYRESRLPMRAGRIVVVP